MLPSYQLYFNNGKKATSSTYYLRQILPDNPANTPAQSDGATLISYGGNLLQMFGWLGGPQSNKVYSSSDLGRTFSSLPDAPFSSAEQQAEIRNDGKIWIWPTTAGKIYKYDGAFTLVSNNYPVIFTPINIKYNDKLLTFGGQSAIGGTPVNDSNVYRYNDGTDAWDVIGQTPSSVWMCTGCAWVNGGYIYATGGAKVNAFNGTYEFLNDTIIRSGDGGVTWTTHATLPSGMRAMWSEACVFDNKVWYLNGYSNGANQAGLWYSTNNGISWTLFTNTIPARHATSMCVHDNSLYIGWGNYHNDLWRIEKISYPAQGFIVPQVQTWWEKNWPLERPSNALLTAVNTFFNTLNTQTSLNPLKKQLQCLDYFTFIAGIELETQFLIPMLSTNTNYLNSTTKVNGNPTWTTNGATTTLGAGAPIYLLDWNASANAVNYSLNSASLIEYTLADVTDDFYEFGDGTSYIIRHHSDLGGRFYGQLNSADFAVTPVLSGKGYTGVSRLDALNVDVVIDSTHNAAARASSAIGGARFSICGINNAGTYGSIHRFGFIGIGNNEIDHDKLRVAIQAFFTTRGVAF